MSKRRSRRSKYQSKLARERIDKLLSLANSVSSNQGITPKRCIKFAKSLSKRYNQRFTSFQKISFCRRCSSKYNSTNSRFRIVNKGWKSTTCLECGSIFRFKID